LVFIGIVTRVNANNGEIFVKVQNGFELKEIHDVQLTSPTEGQALVYNGSLWVNESVSVIAVNLDGGKANSVYGGISPILGGNAVLV